MDVDKVRGLLAQIDEGIVELEVVKGEESKFNEAGVKGLLGHRSTWVEEATTQKSKGDALFPILEQALDSLGYLDDVSEVVQDPRSWQKDGLPESHPPGSIVRFTAPGKLFDSRFLADSLTNFSAVSVGLQNLGFDRHAGGSFETKPVPPKAKIKVQEKASAQRGKLAIHQEWQDRPAEERIPENLD
ncbi:MAG: hypothetical protein Q4G46_16205, partial [Propionibacteriaceae bacterium]|nr:hypothetical protein [Propionibacteriaceae bacterium]